jgi:hypothetical protein
MDLFNEDFLILILVLQYAFNAAQIRSVSGPTGPTSISFAFSLFVRQLGIGFLCRNI